MKKAVLIITIICIANVYASAQTNLALTESKEIQVLGFGGPLFEISNINGSVGIATGGGGAITLNGFFLGGYGMNLRSNISQFVDNQEVRLHFEHGGFWLGYMINNSKKITWSLSSKIGWGDVGFLQDNQLNFVKRNALVFTPELTAELKIARYFRICAGFSYRLTEKLESPLLKNNNLNGIGGNLTLKFGWF